MQKTESENPRKILETALWYLGRRDRSEKELEGKLVFRGYNEEGIKEAISKLKDLGLLDDLNFAKNYIRSSMCGKAKGKKRIVFELKRKGVGDGDIEQAICCMWPEDEEEIVMREAKRALEKYRNQLREKKYQKSIAYLMRRGFPYEISKRKVLELLDTKSGF